MIKDNKSTGKNFNVCIFSKNIIFVIFEFSFFNIVVPIQGEIILSNKNNPGKMSSL